MKKSIKDRINEAKAKTRAAMKRGGAILGNAKPLAVAGGAGAVGEMAADFIGDKVDMVGQNWWGQPAVMLGGALLVRKKSQSAALGLAGAAGAIASFNYKLKQFQEGKRQTAPYRLYGQAPSTTSTPQLPAGKTTQALQDADMVYGDTSALQDVAA